LKADRRRFEMLRGKRVWLAAAALLGVAVFGAIPRMVDAQSSNTPVNLTGMWVMGYENGNKGRMNKDSLFTAQLRRTHGPAGCHP
jgi:hypothetical protein